VECGLLFFKPTLVVEKLVQMDVEVFDESRIRAEPAARYVVDAKRFRISNQTANAKLML